MDNDVTQSVLMTLAEFVAARETSDTCMRIGEDRVMKVLAQVLKRQFHKLQMEETESMNDYAMCLITLVGTIRTFGGKLEVGIVEKFLCSTTDKFTYIICMLEQLYDIADMSIMEVTGHLWTCKEMHVVVEKVREKVLTNSYTSAQIGSRQVANESMTAAKAQVTQSTTDRPEKASHKVVVRRADLMSESHVTWICPRSSAITSTR